MRAYLIRRELEALGCQLAGHQIGNILPDLIWVQALAGARQVYFVDHEEQPLRQAGNQLRVDVLHERKCQPVGSGAPC